MFAMRVTPSLILKGTFCTTVIPYFAGSGCQVPPGQGVVALLLAPAE